MAGDIGRQNGEFAQMRSGFGGEFAPAHEVAQGSQGEVHFRGIARREKGGAWQGRSAAQILGPKSVCALTVYFSDESMSNRGKSVKESALESALGEEHCEQGSARRTRVAQGGLLRGDSGVKPARLEGADDEVLHSSPLPWR